MIIVEVSEGYLEAHYAIYMLLCVLKFSIIILNINNYKYWVTVNFNIINNITCEVRVLHPIVTLL